MAIDEAKLNEFVGRFVTDLGATVGAGNVVIGHRLGLYHALDQGPATPVELAARTGTTLRYIDEWLRGQAAGGYVTYDALTGQYSLTEEQAFCLANPDGAVDAPGAFVLALGSRISGFDYHAGLIELARKRAADAGLAQRTTFEVASAQTFPGSGYDLVATFDCLHDMGDPLGAARHVRDALAPDGTWLIVEPNAGDSVAANLNPVGRVYYGFSNFLCVPNALSQSGGYSLGAQAGEAAIRRIATDAGFTRFRRATETPFNLVFGARR